MNLIALLVWIAASLTILYFVGWNLWILYNQRRVWKDFSKKHDLDYNVASLSASPMMSGLYRGYGISLFTGEHLAGDRRGMRKLTAVEVQLKSDFKFEGGAASGDMRRFLVEDLGLTDEIVIEDPDWTKLFKVASADKKAFQTYLTKERRDKLLSLARLKNAWVILVFRGDTALLRLDTPDALASERKLNVLVNNMIKVAEVLES